MPETEIIIPGGHAAVRVSTGQFIEITDVEGGQVAEPVAFAIERHHEWLSITHTVGHDAAEPSSRRRSGFELAATHTPRRSAAGRPFHTQPSNEHAIQRDPNEVTIGI